jgi:class 3 adenylate cyclase
VVLWLVPSNPMLALIEFRDLEYRRSRARLNAQPLQPPDPRILIVGIDDEVFAQQRFNRVEHARLVDRLSEAGARSVFLDLLFEEPRQPEVDQQLLEALKRSRRSIVGAAYRLDLESATHEVQSPVLMDSLLESLRRRHCLSGILNASQSESRSEFTLIFQDLGDDPDWAGMQPSPAVTILTQLFRLQAGDVSIQPGSRWQGPMLTIPPLRLETQQLDRGRLQLYRVPVRFRPPVTGPQAVVPSPLTFPRLPYLALADGDPQALSQVKGKIVLVGETTSGDDDIIDTPVGRMKGVEGHANVLDSLLSGRLPHFTDTHQRLDLASKILTLVFCYALASLLVRQPDLVRWTLVTLLGFASWEGLILKADSLGYFLNQTQGETSLALTALIVLFFRFMISARVLRTFIPSEIVDQLLVNAEIHQGVVDATVMVTDIRGYTTLSESRTPLQVLQLLNDYHTETVSLYQDFGGYVLNYQGDAQIILFGHPKKLKDPARQAILAAQAASGAVERLRARWKLPADQQFNVGAGICSGPVIIADLGAEHREYTVIGELVRKCHKLQSQSQILAANIIMDEATYDRCQQKPEVEKRENVEIEGLPDPTTVYVTDLVPSAS